MIRSKKIFTGGANQDDSLHLLDESQYLRVMNARVGITQFGRNNRVEGVPGTTVIPQSVYPPYGTNITIGSCIDIENERLLWLIYNSWGDHGIYCYDMVANQTYAVIYDSQIEGGLNFNKDYRIDRNCKVINGVLYWSDNYNEPKKINIDKGIKTNQAGYSTNETAYEIPPGGIPYTTFTIIRRPPYYALNVNKAEDVSFDNNFIENAAFQMCYFYDFVDNERSRLSAFSNLMNFNTPGETNNYIACRVPLSEYIESEIERINICAKDVVTNVIYIIKTYDRNNPVDALAIFEHNAGTNQLEFDFYNDVVGIPLSLSESSIPYDLVPLKSTTLETATARLFLANNLAGYDTPLTTSLAISSTTSTTPSSNSFVAVVKTYSIAIRNKFDTGDIRSEVVGYLYAAGEVNTVYYYNAYKNSYYNSFPATLDLSDADGQFAYENNFLFWYASNYSPANTNYDWYYPFFGNPTFTFTSGSTPSYYVTIDNDVTSFSAQTVFKSSATYNISIVFYDRFRRRSGVVDKPINYTLPNLTEDQNSFVQYLNWTLSNTNAENEIPDWAYYYQIVQTKNLIQSDFVQIATNGIQYATKQDIASGGGYTYGNTYSIGIFAIGLNISSLTSVGLGYNYKEGDMCRITGSSASYNVQVLGQDGEYVLVEAFDFGTVSTTDYKVIELYTPKKSSTQEPYYEVSQVYEINNPTASNRQYSTINGQLIGDVYILQRIDGASTNYFTENMSPFDKVWQYWNTNSGWPNFITNLGQVRNEYEIRFSNVFTTGTANNGLSTFEALNFKTVPLGMGNIQKLQLASKTTEQGVIMLAIGSFQTASCYLGEVQVVGASQNAFLAQDVAVIGTINILKGMLGTTQPETVVEYLGVIFWYDLNNGQVAQYSSNGVFPISSFKMERLFKNYAKGYLATSAATLDSINGFHHIPTYIDPFHKEFGVSLPGLITENSAELLPSYVTTPSYASSIVNRFDISDNLAKTVVFHLQDNQWKSDYQFLAEQYEYFENRMFGFKNGALYEFNTNTSTWNTWFGTQYPVRICWVLNAPLSGVKNMAEIVIEGNQAPNYTALYTNLPNTQITDLTASDYTNQEGILYARFLRDRLSPNYAGTADEKLLNGDVVLSQIPQIMAEFQSYNSIIYVNFVDIGFNLSRGQNFILGNQ
jgi:hypothetical protein